MIDPLNEDLISVRSLAKSLPGRNGRPLALSTIYRWLFQGRGGHRLESVVVGGQRYTTADSVRRFVEATTAAADSACGSTNSPASQRLRPDLGVEAKLAKFGL